MATTETKQKPKNKVPEPTLMRLPIYLQFLQKIREKGEMNITAPQIGSELDFDSTQIVKDLSVTGVKGKPRIGYNTYELIKSIEEYLGFNRTNEAFLVGAGNLGSALLAYPELQNFGLKIIAAFDVAPMRIGTTVGNVNVLHIDKFADLSQRLKVEIGILTTPGVVAQEVAENMVKLGIRAIWNLTPIKLKLPEHIIVQNTLMYSNVAVLLKKLHQLAPPL